MLGLDGFSLSPRSISMENSGDFAEFNITGEAEYAPFTKGGGGKMTTTLRVQWKPHWRICVNLKVEASISKIMQTVSKWMGFDALPDPPHLPTGNKQTFMFEFCSQPAWRKWGKWFGTAKGTEMWTNLDKPAATFEDVQAILDNARYNVRGVDLKASLPKATRDKIASLVAPTADMKYQLADMRDVVIKDLRALLMKRKRQYFGWKLNRWRAKAAAASQFGEWSKIPENILLMEKLNAICADCNLTPTTFIPLSQPNRDVVMDVFASFKSTHLAVAEYFKDFLMAAQIPLKDGVPPCELMTEQLVGIMKLGLGRFHWGAWFANQTNTDAFTNYLADPLAMAGLQPVLDQLKVEPKLYAAIETAAKSQFDSKAEWDVCCSGAVGVAAQRPDVIKEALARNVLGELETHYEQFITMGFAEFEGTKSLVPKWKYQTGAFKQPMFASGKAWLQRKVRQLKNKMHMAGGIGDLLGIDINVQVCMSNDCKPFDPVDMGALVIQTAVLTACANAMKPKPCPMHTFEIASSKNPGWGNPGVKKTRTYTLKAVVDTALMGSKFNATVEASLDTSTYDVEVKLSAGEKFKKENLFGIEGFSFHSPAIGLKVFKVPCSNKTSPATDLDAACKGAAPKGNGCPTTKADCLACAKCDWIFPTCRPKPTVCDCSSITQTDCVKCSKCTWQASRCVELKKGGRRLLIHEDEEVDSIIPEFMSEDISGAASRSRWHGADGVVPETALVQATPPKKATPAPVVTKPPMTCGSQEPICNTRRFEVSISAKANIGNMTDVHLEVVIEGGGGDGKAFGVKSFGVNVTASYNDILGAVGLLIGVPDFQKVMGGSGPSPGKFDYLEKMTPADRAQALAEMDEGQKAAYESSLKADAKHDYFLKLTFNKGWMPSLDTNVGGPKDDADAAPEGSTAEIAALIEEDDTRPMTPEPHTRHVDEYGLIQMTPVGQTEPKKPSAAQRALAKLRCLYKKAMAKMDAMKEKFSMAFTEDGKPFVPAPVWVRDIIEKAKKKILELFAKVGITNIDFASGKGEEGSGMENTTTYNVTFDMNTTFSFMKTEVAIGMKANAWKQSTDDKADGGFGIDLNGHMRFEKMFGVEGFNTEINTISIARMTAEVERDANATDAPEEQKAAEVETLMQDVRSEWSAERLRRMQRAARAVQNTLDKHHDVAGMLHAHELLHEDDLLEEEAEKTTESKTTQGPQDMDVVENPSDDDAPTEDDICKAGPETKSHWKVYFKGQVLIPGMPLIKASYLYDEGRFQTATLETNTTVRKLFGGFTGMMGLGKPDLLLKLLVKPGTWDEQHVWRLEIQRPEEGSRMPKFAVFRDGEPYSMVPWFLQELKAKAEKICAKVLGYCKMSNFIAERTMHNVTVADKPKPPAKKLAMLDLSSSPEVPPSVQVADDELVDEHGLPITEFRPEEFGQLSNIDELAEQDPDWGEAFLQTGQHATAPPTPLAKAPAPTPPGTPKKMKMKGAYKLGMTIETRVMKKPFWANLSIFYNSSNGDFGFVGTSNSTINNTFGITGLAVSPKLL
jgi:hypothetical protein